MMWEDIFNKSIDLWQGILFLIGIICFYMGILLWWHKPYKYKELKQTQHSRDLERLAQISNDIYNLTCANDGRC